MGWRIQHSRGYTIFQRVIGKQRINESRTSDDRIEKLAMYRYMWRSMITNEFNGQCIRR